MVEQRLVDGRRPGQHGDPVFGDRAQRLLGVEGQLRDQRGAGLQAGQDAGLVTEVVEERVDAQVAVVAGDLAAGGPRRRAGQRLPVRTQHAFAAAGGAGGEQDVGDVVGPRPPRRGRPPPRGRMPWPMNSSHVSVARLLDRGPARCDADRAVRIAVEVGDSVGAEELAHREQQRGAGACQDVGRPRGGVAGVQRHDDGAGVVGGQAGDHPVPGVRRPDRHPIAGLHVKARSSPRPPGGPRRAIRRK